jgi:hypothetical protein
MEKVVDILDELHRSSNIESMREIALNYQQTIKEYYQNLAEMSLANRNLYNKLLEVSGEYVNV